MYKGQCLSLKRLDAGLVELNFSSGKSVNVINESLLDDLESAVGHLTHANDVKGLLLTSSLPAFIVGADITEFTQNFSLPDTDLSALINKTHALFSRLENLPFPTVTAINGMALGGGFELALCTDFRVASENAKVGLPEAALGICPGWGGTVRLSRLISCDTSLEWIIKGRPVSAQNAAVAGAIDKVVPIENLTQAAIACLKQAVNGQLSWQDNRNRKIQPLLDSSSSRQEIEDLKQKYVQKVDPNLMAPRKIVEAICSHAFLSFEKAIETEVRILVELAKSDQAKALIGLFLIDKDLKSTSKERASKAKAVQKAAVLGAGIMGGGVAYQSAIYGTPIVMKDISSEALDLGMSTASSLLDKSISRGKLKESDKEVVLSNIHPTLEYSGFDEVDFVVEAVVENENVKTAVLSEIESKASQDAVLASNTSTISITSLAQGLEKPESFCGMHFFNPVHLMQLVEVIQGEKTSENTTNKAVAYALSMGKTPIVVNDCPGFLVNRILFPYFNAFNRLLIDGVCFERIDRLMEQFGWPMGPAYLADVVGIDTLVHGDQVMQQGFPDRMLHESAVIAEQLLERNCLGQKNKVGFYEYFVDADGKRGRKPSDIAQALLSEHAKQNVELSDQEIIDRMMIPMCLEAIRCLDDAIVETPGEVDMGLIMGLGFPRFRGGALRYIDSIGVDAFIDTARKLEANGPLYTVTESLISKQKKQQTYY